MMYTETGCQGLTMQNQNQKQGEKWQICNQAIPCGLQKQTVHFLGDMEPSFFIIS